MHVDPGHPGHPDPTDGLKAPWDYTLYVPNDARAIGIARTTLRAVLTRHRLAPLLDSAELLASELLTNAYRHSDGPASLRLRWADGTLRIGVWDTSAQPPEASASGKGAEDEDGRGMLVVDICAAKWGWFALGDDLFGICGKYVWCELSLRPGEFTTAA